MVERKGKTVQSKKPKKRVVVRKAAFDAVLDRLIKSKHIARKN
jgi:hypothetical protein